ncbi:MAG TPA: hypothetical protein VFD58_21455 [Blastocatellia bacterium]|nr:hypothetical protein [Blastocatellia bacterium]
MSGYISLNNGKNWMVAGWAYRGALDQICKVLREKNADSDLLEFLTSEEKLPRTLQALYLSELTSEQARLFSEAAGIAFERCRAEGPVGWYDPSFFPAFMEGFRKLVEILGEAGS